MMYNSRWKASGLQSDIIVVTIWHNREHQVEDSMKSIIDQSYNDYSIFAVDDGSTDRTPLNLEPMLDYASERGVPMKLWEKHNEGFTVSLKKAIEEHTYSNIIALHGAGDISKEDRLKQQKRLLLSSDQTVAAGVSTQTINKEGKVIGKRIRDKVPKKDLRKGIIPRPGTHEAVMYDRGAYEKVGGYRTQFRFAQDIDLWLRLSEIGRFSNTQDILYQKLSSDHSYIHQDCTKRFYQIMCFEAAITSAYFRATNAEDPINSIDGEDSRQIINIARSGAISPATHLRLARYIQRTASQREVHCLTQALSFLSYKEALLLIRYLPRWFKSIK